jgi:hypothetical protein
VAVALTGAIAQLCWNGATVPDRLRASRETERRNRKWHEPKCDGIKFEAEAFASFIHNSECIPLLLFLRLPSTEDMFDSDWK